MTANARMVAEHPVRQTRSEVAVPLAILSSENPGCAPGAVKGDRKSRYTSALRGDDGDRGISTIFTRAATRGDRVRSTRGTSSLEPEG